LREILSTVVKAELGLFSQKSSMERSLLPFKKKSSHWKPL
jgi:hypothetical protein